MSFIAFILILSSVLLHALWHFLSKSSKPAPAFFVLVSGANILTTLSVALTSGVELDKLPPLFFLMMIGGGFSGMVCDCGLSLAYRKADVSMAYPLARALPVLSTAAITVMLGLGKRPSPLALTGMAVIFVGCLAIPLKKLSDLSWKNYFNRALLGILIAAAGTTGYTIFDSEGIRILLENTQVSRWRAAATYSCMRETVLFILLVTFVMSIPSERRMLNRELIRSVTPYLAGVFAGVAYIFILIANGFVTNVSFVQAFRQMSLPVGVALGIIFLKEKCYPARIAGVFLVVAGLIITVL